MSAPSSASSTPAASDAIAELPRRGRGFARAVQVTAGLAALLVFVQAVFAGHLLTGSSVALTLHEVTGAEILGWVVLTQVAAAVLLWRPGRGPGWPALVSVLVFVAVFVQIVVGFEGRLAIHVPNGVAILLVECWIATGAGRLARPRRVA